MAVSGSRLCTNASHMLPISTFLILELHVHTRYDLVAPPVTKGCRDFDLHGAQKIHPQALSCIGVGMSPNLVGLQYFLALRKRSARVLI